MIKVNERALKLGHLNEVKEGIVIDYLMDNGFKNITKSYAEFKEYCTKGQLFTKLIPGSELFEMLQNSIQRSPVYA